MIAPTVCDLICRLIVHRSNFPQMSAKGVMAADVDLKNRAISSDPYVTVEVYHLRVKGRPFPFIL